MNIMHMEKVKRVLNIAFECSIYLAPKEPGLTYDEIHEVGQRMELQQGEIGDALRLMNTMTFGAGSRRLMPDVGHMHLDIFPIANDPEYRNFAALDFVCSEMNERIKADGGRNAKLPRDVLVERAVARGLPRLDIEAAITVFALTEHWLVEKDGHLLSNSAGIYHPLPSEQRHQQHITPRHDEARKQIYSIVKDVIARRSDGRPPRVEPLDGFADALEKLGYRRFRLWWTQTVGELRQSNPQSSPVAALVLAAALVEGALTFVVKHARNSQLGVFASTDFAENPRKWRIDDLVSSAARGGDSAILDTPIRQRAESLIVARQRIHAGRMLSDHPDGTAPDLRPDEAREAKATAELVVRRVLDWLEKYPPP